MGERRSVDVWLILRDKENAAGKVLLQQKAEFIDEGKTRAQSNPFICQPTCSGNVKTGEKLIKAIFRGIQKELGVYFKDNFRSQWVLEEGILEMFCIMEYTHKGEQVISYNFVGLISQRQMKLIKLHSRAMPEFITVGKTDLLQRVKSNQDPNANPKKEIVLFQDQYKALEKLFSLKAILSKLG